MYNGPHNQAAVGGLPAGSLEGVDQIPFIGDQQGLGMGSVERQIS